MKYFKLTLFILVAAAALTGIIYLTFKQKINNQVNIPGSNIKKEKIEKDIHDKIESAPNNSFCPQSYLDIQKKIDLFFQNQASDKATYTLKLQGAYCRKFVQQANYVFDGTQWKNISTIRKELDRCLTFFPHDPDLQSIKKILDTYKQLEKFNSKVTQACKQQPKCLTDAHYFYKLDDWDVNTTQRLLAAIPSATGKVTNSPMYRNTRKNKVETRLKEAHTKFIQQKMEKSEEEATSYSHNPQRFSDYTALGRQLTKCFDTYYQLWGVSTSQWRTQLGNWEQYVEPLVTMSNLEE